MVKIYWEKLFRRFLFWRPIRETIHASHKITPWGFQGLSLFDVAKFFIEGLQKGSITQRAAALSFSFFLAIFPTIIFFFTLIPYLPIAHLQAEIYANLELIIPDAAYDMVKSTIDGIMLKKHNSLLSFGFLAALYFSTNGMDAIIKAFNQTTHAIESRKFVKRKLICLALVLITVFLIVIIFSFIIGYQYLLDYLVNIGFLSNGFVYYLFIFGKWCLLVLLTCLTISSFYYMAPANKKGFRFISAGSILATILFIVLMVGFNIYIDNFSRYNALYGSIGTLLIILLWIYFNAIVLLIGFELDASIASTKEEMRKESTYKALFRTNRHKADRVSWNGME